MTTAIAAARPRLLTQPFRFGARLPTALPLRRRPDGDYELVAADLFCGAGGTSTGLVDAVEELERVYGVKIHLRLVAVNHWPVAIETHSANHAFAQHHCNSLLGVDPTVVIPGFLDILVASPECTHHSNARGGKPVDDQSRSSGDDVVRWVRLKRPGMVLIENVVEYRSWGPVVARLSCRQCGWKGAKTLAAAHLAERAEARARAQFGGLKPDGLPCMPQDLRVDRDAKGQRCMVPDPLRKGEFYQRFLNQIRGLGYAVHDINLVAADYGDPTTRKRLFVFARRAPELAAFPAADHAKVPVPGSDRQPWRTARQDVLDLNDRGLSIFNREAAGKKPLKWKTLWRIAAGMFKINGIDLRAVFVKLYGTGQTVPIDLPCPTITGGGNHIFLAQPFLIGQQSGATARSSDEPVPAVAARGAISKVAPALIQYNGTADAKGVDEPLGTVTSKDRFGVADPFLTAHFGERPTQEPRVHSIDAPAPAVTPRGAGDLAIPFLTEYHDDKAGAERVRPTTDPLPTLDCSNRFGLASPVLLGTGGPEGSSKPHSADESLGTVITENHRAVAQPFLVPMNHDNAAQPIDAPAQTVTGQGNRLNLASPFMMSAGGPEVAPRSAEDPAHTVLTRDHIAVVQPAVLTPGEAAAAAPFIAQVSHGPKAGEDSSNRVRSADEPLVTVTGANRGELAVVHVTLVKYTHNVLAQAPQNALLLRFADGSLWLLDIFFRMLRYRELARAQSFPDTYQFKGTLSDIVKQIGNAVPRKLARALCYAAMLQLPQGEEPA